MGAPDRPRRALGYALVAVAVLATAGCRTRPLDPSLDGDGGARVDLGDTKPLDLAGACAAHQRRATKLTGLARLDPADSMRSDRAVRVTVTMALPPCDEPAGFDVAISPGNATDFVSITAYRWEGTGPSCNGPARAVVRGLLIGDERLVTNPRMVVRDTQGGVADLMLALKAPQPGSCVGVADGAPCDRDCQCLTTNARARCIPTATGARCGIPCSTDAECPPPATPKCDDRADGRLKVCGPRINCCMEDSECGRPLFCERCFCLQPDIPPPFATACSCDSQCPRGAICDAARGRCVLSCETAAQCPSWAVACLNGECAFGE